MYYFNLFPKSFFQQTNLNPFTSFLFQESQFTSPTFKYPPFSQSLQLTPPQKHFKNSVIDWLKNLNKKQRSWILLVDDQQIINRISKVISCFGISVYFTIGPAELYHPIKSLESPINNEFLEMIHFYYGFNPKIITNQDIDSQEIIRIMDQISGGRLFCNWISQLGFATVDQWIVYFIQIRTIRLFENQSNNDTDILSTKFIQQTANLLQLIQSSEIRKECLKFVDPKIMDQIPCVIRFPIKYMKETECVREVVRKLLCLQIEKKDINAEVMIRKNSQRRRTIKGKVNHKKKHIIRPENKRKKQKYFKSPEIQFYLSSYEKKFIIQPKITTIQPLVINNPYHLKYFENNSTCDSIADMQEYKKQLQLSNYLGKKLIEKIIKLKRNNDFLELSNYMSMKYNSTIKERRLILQRLRTVIGSINNNFEIKLFGSNATGISLYQSDIDILIQMHYQKKMITNVFNEIQIKLQLLDWIVEIKKILTAQIPILKLIVDSKIVSNNNFDSQQLPSNFEIHTNKMNKHFIKVDISVQTGYQLGLISTNFIKEWLKQNQLNSVIVILKYILKKRHLNQNYTGISYLSGGLSSYGLVLLVAAYVKYAKVKEKKHFQIFMSILDFYGNKFNPRITAIDLQKQPSQIFYQVEQKEDIYLHLIDPIIKKEILMHTYRILDIQSAFSETYHLVQKMYRQSKEILVSHTKIELGLRDGIPFQQKFKIACNNLSQNVIKKSILII